MIRFLADSENDKFYDIETQKGKHIKVCILNSSKSLIAYVWNSETCEWKQFLEEQKSNNVTHDQLATKVESILVID